MRTFVRQPNFDSSPLSSSVVPVMGLWLAILLSVMGISLSAWATPQHIVVLARDGQGLSAQQSEWMARTLRRALRKQRKLKVLQNQAVQKTLVERVIPQEVPTRIAELKQYLQRAQQLSRITRFPFKTRCNFVLKALAKVDEILAQIQTYLEEPDLIRDLYLYSALAHHGLSDEEKALRYTLQLVYHAPSFTPSGNEFPQSFLDYHRSWANKVNARPRYTMQIDSVPTGAKVYHNYRLVGQTPYTLTDLVSGKHFIRLVKTAYAVWERAATLNVEKLGTKRSITAKIPLQQDPNALVITGFPLYDKDATFSDEILDRLDKINTRLNSHYLFVTEPSKTQNGTLLRVALYKANSRKILYDTINLGASSDTFRSNLLSYARRLAQQILSGALAARKQ